MKNVKYPKGWTCNLCNKRFSLDVDTLQHQQEFHSWCLEEPSDKDYVIIDKRKQRRD